MSETKARLPRILYLINYAGNGGSEKYVYNLIKAYHGKRAECFFAYNEPGQLSEQIAEEGITSFRIKMNSSFDFAAAKQLAKICRTHEIDVIHAQYPRENYTAILSKLYYRKPKVVYTCHLLWDAPKWHKPINRLMTSGNHKIISVCNCGARKLAENGLQKGKIQVIYNGVLPANAEAPSTIRTELGIAEDTFVITTVARFDAIKRLDLLTEAVAKLKQTAKRKFAALYVGDGEQREAIETQIRNLGLQDVIYLTGYRTDADNILRGSNLFVNCSESEALSFAILEALSHALPVVATDVGGNPDILNAENNCGILVPFGDTTALANAICQFMDDSELHTKCAANAKRAADGIFHLNKILDDTFAVYH